ncbi:MAG TPA: GAF domain-containing sensor histidine kinase [Thermodesulfovibrionales bacterium]|nr:GAF domain-containing sensor histidine kinase [Thermodesulfovibrionales bacterium]
MHEILIKYLESNPTLLKYHLSEQEISELAGYIRKFFLSAQVQVGEVIKMVEEVIGISPTLGWKEILETVAKKVVEFLHAEAATIRIFDPETDRLVSFGSYQYTETARLKDIPVEKSVAGKVIKSGKSYLVPNILLEPDYLNKDIVKEYGFNSLMAVPINIPRFLENKPDIQGTIQIYYRENDREFDPLEITSAELMARRVSYVLAKKRILELQRLNLLKEKIVEKIFVKLSHREGIKMKDVFMLMIPELEAIMQIQSCSLFTITLDRKHVHIELEYPTGQETHDVHCVFAIKDHPYIDALINVTEKRGDDEYERIDSSYILIKDPLKSRLSNDELRRYASKHNVNSVLLIPLKARDEINYFLVFYATDRRQEFTEQEIELLSFFGKEIMKALRIEKLDDILHDFKNPGIAIAGFAKKAKILLEQENIESVRDKIAEYLDIVVDEAIRMQEIAIYPNIEGRERGVDLTEILKSRFRINEEAIREQKRTNIKLIQDELERGLFIYCYPFALERVLDNLLDNATKAVPEEGGELSIKSYRSGEMACFEIRNTGRIPEEKIEQIRKGDVKGRGLNIIYRFIQAIQGSLEVFTDSDSTTFRVMIPLHRE